MASERVNSMPHSFVIASNGDVQDSGGFGRTGGTACVPRNSNVVRIARSRMVLSIVSI
jgi:hypothetical protein